MSQRCVFALFSPAPVSDASCFKGVVAKKEELKAAFGTENQDEIIKLV
jgi:hypothetical protein